VSAAEGAEGVRVGFVEPAMAAGWSIAMTVTPTAARWLDHGGELDRLSEVTGHVVRVSPRLPYEVSPHPPIDVYAVVPASANTVAKMALGIADNQLLTTAAEALGSRDTRVVVFPAVNAAHARHPLWEQHLAVLRRAGVSLVYGPDVWPPHEPRTEPGIDPPWSAILRAVNEAYGTR
jgi:hypothetical protein